MAAVKTVYRSEHDSIGERSVPKDVYYGVQSLRAAENFHITGLTMHPEIINSIAEIKKASAITNYEIGLLDKRVADAIVRACDEIAAGKLHEAFIVDPIQGGAGTSLNMNANEVIANRAIELLGGEKGDYALVNPNDHVNYGQSTNDVFPSAGKMAVLKLLIRAQIQLERLYAALTQKAEEFDGVIKMGRTQMQDAVPIRLGQEFRAYSEAIRRDIVRLERAQDEMRCLNMGGTAIGTGINADEQYLRRIVPNLSKMCNDLRLLSSGPRCGFNEINLPPRQNGSSIMPGKVNPVIPEVVNQVAFHIIGGDMTVTMAAEAGQLELNAFEPIIFYHLIQSVETLTYAVHTLVDNCIVGITANAARCKAMVDNSVGIITALCPHIGYEAAADLAKRAIETGGSVKDLILEEGVLDEETLEKILDPYSMTEPGISAKELLER